MPSPFDFSTFATSTTYDATAVDYKWHNVPDGEYMAQLKEFGRSVELDEQDFQGRKMISAKFRWSLMDIPASVRADMNLPEDAEVIVEQDMLIECLKGGSKAIDFGVNKNQALKNLMLATGNANNKKFNPGHLLAAVAWVTVKSAPRKGGDPEQLFAAVTRVVELEVGRAAWAAKQAA